MAKRNIYLAGFMGTGKSTIGRELARVMGRKNIDIDQELERKFNATIAEMFDTYGEQWFRAQEKALCLEVAEMSNKIVAAGGGALMDPDVFEAFDRSGLLICLYTQRECLVERLERSDKRPLLNGVNIPETVDTLLAKRQGLYDKIRIRIDTTNLTPMSTAKKIADLINTRQKILEKLGNQYIDLS
ncbi:MAG: shikimate kinase [bacterium]|nr:shikimate kinase [bacterium]